MENSTFIFSKEIYEQYLSTINNIKFTSREIDVITCLLHGKSAKGIASFLSSSNKVIGERSVESHIYNIKRKIGGGSKESIINFIERTNKYKITHSYYSSLLLQKEFQQSLKEITVLVKKYVRSFTIVLYQLTNDEDQFLILLAKELQKDLEVLASEVSLTIQRDFIDTNQVKDEYTIYIIPTTFKEIHSINNDSAFCSKSNARTICLFQEDTNILNKINPSIKYTNIKQQQNYYFLFFAILKSLFPQLNIDKALLNFTEKHDYITNNSSNVIFEHCNVTDKVLKVKTSISKFKTVIVCFTIFCSILVIFSIGKYNISHKNPYINKNLLTWNIPKQDHIFIGRKNLLEEIDSKLNEIPTSKSNNIVLSACTGLGGIGKTQLALHYVHNTKNHYTLKAWFPSENLDYLYNSYIRFAQQLGYKEKIYNREVIISYIKKWLSENTGWLLVYDNVNDYNEIKEFLPEMGGHVILTTRQRQWPENFSIVSVDIMTEKEAILTLKTIIKRNIENETAEIKELVKTLGYLPLALVQAGAYIQQNNISVIEYLSLYKNYELELLADNTFIKTEVPHIPVAVTWNISLENIAKRIRIDGELPIALEMLVVCSYLSPDKISRKLLLAWLKDRYPNLSSLELIMNQHIKLLWQYSMINYNDIDNISIHRLVQTVLRHQLQQSLGEESNSYFELNLQWFESLLKFFIENETELKLTSSFQQLIETSNKFKATFNGQYNDNLASLDLIIAPVHFNQENYQSYIELLNKVNLYLENLSSSKFLKCKILYLYSAYFRKIGNILEAENKINEALSIFETINIDNTVKKNDLKNLKAKILFNKSNIAYVKNKIMKIENEKNKQEIEFAIRCIENAIILFKDADNTRDWLRAIELYGRLLIVSNNGLKVLEEFDKYNKYIEEIADDRTKMLFYLTYSDAYVTNKDYKKALYFCDLAENQAKKLNLTNELNNITNKKTVIRGSLQEGADFSR